MLKGPGMSCYSFRSLRASLGFLGAEFLHHPDPGMMAEAGTPTQAARAQSRAASCCHPVEDPYTEGKWSTGGSLQLLFLFLDFLRALVTKLFLKLLTFHCAIIIMNVYELCFAVFIFNWDAIAFIEENVNFWPCLFV